METLVLGQFMTDFRVALESAWAEIVRFVPRLGLFLLVLVVGWLVARVVLSLVDKLLTAARLDPLMERTGLAEPLRRAGFERSGRFVALVLYYALLLLVLQLALGVFGPNAVQDAVSQIVAFIPNILVALIIIIVTGIFASVVNRLLAPAYESTDVGGFLRRIVTIAIWVIGAFAAIDQLGVARTIVDTLFTAVVGALSLILIIKFGVGGIWAARDRFWPAVYDRVSNAASEVRERRATARERETNHFRSSVVRLRE
jgi:fumarate reductase subunit D